MSNEVKINGLDDLIATLTELPNKLRRRALRNALAAGARVVRDVARAKRRSDSAYSAATDPNPTAWRHGTVEKAISVRTSKQAARGGDVGVFVNVKPMRTGGGRNNPDDPFYWRWLEFGAKGNHQEAKPFLQPAASALGQALDVFTEQFGKQMKKLEVNGKDPL
jgi:HK97 gp10 family phage protein